MTASISRRDSLGRTTGLCVDSRRRSDGVRSHAETDSYAGSRGDDARLAARARAGRSPTRRMGVTCTYREPRDEEERRQLDDGHTVVKVLEPTERSHLSVFAASRIKVTPQRFTERIRNTPRLWRGPKVPRTGMFGTSPRAEDVAAMTLPPEDVHALRRCRPGDCDVKLSAAEMARIHEAIRSEPRNWEARVQHELRRIVLDRIAMYRRGRSGLPDEVSRGYRTAFEHGRIQSLNASSYPSVDSRCAHIVCHSN